MHRANIHARPGHHVRIAIFLLLLLVLTGTFLSALGVVGWFLLFVIGLAILSIYDWSEKPGQVSIASTSQVADSSERY